MNEPFSNSLLAEPSIVECEEYIESDFLHELQQLEVTWGSPVSDVMPVREEVADETASHTAHSSLASPTTTNSDESPPFLTFDSVHNSPTGLGPDSLSEGLPHHEPARVVDFVATNGERVLVNMGSDFLGEGAVARIYSGTLQLLRPGEAEVSESTTVFPVACRVRQLERWVIRSRKSMEIHQRCRHVCIIQYYMTTVHHHHHYASRAHPKDSAVVSILERADKGNLRDIVSARGNLTSDVIRTVLQDILSALRHLHDDMHVAHNDVKPGNILLCSDLSRGTGEAGVRFKLSDFDCAVSLESSKQLEARLRAATNELPPSGEVCGAGTTVYMAPEVSLGLCRFAANDVWSLGVTAFQLVSGSLPWRPLECQYPELITASYREKFARGDLFRHDSAVKSGGDDASGFGPALSFIASDLNCPPQLRDFITQCLREDPQARPTCGQLLQHPFVRVQPAN